MVSINSSTLLIVSHFSRVHVVRAATIIGYAQLALLGLFSALLLYVFAHAAIQGIPSEGWVKRQGGEK